MKKFKRIVSLALVLVTIFSVFAISASAASTTAFDVLSNTNYAKTYTVSSSGRTIPYINNKLITPGTETYGKSSKAYIDNSVDEIYVFDVGYTNGAYWAYVSYPTSSRRVKAYIPLSAIAYNNEGHQKTVSTGKFYCSTRENKANNSSYYVAKGDTVYLVSKSSSKYQILYPISGGKWRLAWCNKSDYQKYCSGGGNNITPVSGLTDVTAYFANQRITIKSVQNGRFLCADANIGYTPMMANKTSASTWETFTVTSLTSDGWVGLKSSTNGRYLTANRDVTNTPIRASAVRLQSWECFRIYQKGTHFYIKAQANNRWLCTRIDLGSAPVQAYASSPLDWERFSINIIGSGQYVSVAEIIKTASDNSIKANSSAYKALLSVNNKYANKLTSSQRRGSVVFVFEGTGNDSSASKRMNAMCIIVKNGDIVYLNRNCSTIPDYPFNPSKNQGTPMPTIKSGVYSFTTVNHQGKYAALNVTNAGVVRFRTKNSYYTSTSYAINVHRRDSNSIASASSGWVNSAGCLLIGKSGTGSSGEYASFIKTLGIVGSGASGSSKYSNYVSGKIVIDRTYASAYLSNVGYSRSAISAIG